jgi:hypothetical protein
MKTISAAVSLILKEVRRRRSESRYLALIRLDYIPEFLLISSLI